MVVMAWLVLGFDIGDGVLCTYTQISRFFCHDGGKERCQVSIVGSRDVSIRTRFLRMSVCRFPSSETTAVCDYQRLGLSGLGGESRRDSGGSSFPTTEGGAGGGSRGLSAPSGGFAGLGGGYSLLDGGDGGSKRLGAACLVHLLPSRKVEDLRVMGDYVSLLVRAPQSLSIIPSVAPFLPRPVSLGNHHQHYLSRTCFGLLTADN